MSNEGMEALTQSVKQMSMTPVAIYQREYRANNKAKTSEYMKEYMRIYITTDGAREKKRACDNARSARKRAIVLQQRAEAKLQATPIQA